MAEHHAVADLDLQLTSVPSWAVANVRIWFWANAMCSLSLSSISRGGALELRVGDHEVIRRPAVELLRVTADRVEPALLDVLEDLRDAGAELLGGLRRRRFGALRYLVFIRIPLSMRGHFVTTGAS